MPAIYIQCDTMFITVEGLRTVYSKLHKAANEAKQNVQKQKKTKRKISICPKVHAFTCQLIIDDNNFKLK